MQNLAIHVVYYIIDQPSLNVLDTNWTRWPLGCQNCNYIDLSKSLDNKKKLLLFFLRNPKRQLKFEGQFETN